MAVPNFTAEASLAAPGTRVTRAHAMPRANTIGKSCDDQQFFVCTADPACSGLIGQAFANCRRQLIAECRDAFGCSTGEHCSPGGAGSICCPGTQTNCAGTCRTLASDPQNCGACGVACGPGGACCNGICRNLAADPANCGSCGTVCPSGAACINGSCGCPPGTTNCFGTCTNLSNDPQNCGSCGTDCRGASCVNGVCGPRPCDDQQFFACTADPVPGFRSSWVNG